MTEARAGAVETEVGEVVAGRYRIEGTLGRGGVAVVYQAFDSASGRQLALKRLLTRSGRLEQNAVGLFEREFFTLAHLVHPRIVTAYDYGIDEIGPYYTMELLDGGDLQRRAPMEFREACTVARDVCSALSLLHSRRMVYRDLSPRNVRCTSNGLAKLIDFGAMSAMGPSREWVGTLPFCAPEVVNSQPLDARTDLYSLGATLYYALTRRHAYPARDVPHLYGLWQARPPRPSELVPGIPEALDCLVMDLMHPDPTVRPTSAAEVMECLSAIAELPADEQPLVSKAYLLTPTLVGRAEHLGRIRRIVSRSLRRRGTGLLLSGAPGVGRSRLLEACVLEAKLAGAVVLQADSRDVREGGYGVIRALAAQLLRAAPDLARRAAENRLAVLGHVIPELLENSPGVVLEKVEDPEQLCRSVQPALRRWLFDVSRRKPLLIAVDDVHELDEPSAAFLALLSQEVSEHAIVVAVTAVTDAPTSPTVLTALKLLSDSSASITVDPLSVAHTEELLRSVFNDGPNLQLLAHCLYGITDGHPRDILRLAQHLVDNGVIRYQAGAWSVPDRIDRADVPSSMAEAIAARVGALSANARQLVRTMAYEPKRHFSLAECLLLTEHRKTALVLASLEELVAEGLLRSTGQHFDLDQEGLLSALAGRVDEQEESRAHLRLAEVFRLRGDGFRFAQHLVHGGETDSGLDALIDHAERSRQETSENPAAYSELLQTLPEDWFAFYELGIRLCHERGRPAKQLYKLRARLSGLMSISLGNHAGAPHYSALIDQLYRAAGLDIHAALDSLEPAPRLKQSLARAKLRYDENPDADFVLAPMAAIPELVRALLEAMGLIAFAHDYPFLKQLPSLAPLEPLSPSLTVAVRLRDGLEARIAGRTEESLKAYRAYIRRLLEPDGAGIAPTLRLYTRLRVMGSVGILEAGMGLTSSLKVADEVQVHPLCESTGVLIRMLYHLWQGDTSEAERCQRQVEVLQIQSGSRQVFGGQHLLSELAAHALADDLTRVKRTTAVIEPFAEVHAGWAPVLHYGRGEYQRIRGDHSSALQEFETALSLLEPGRHQIWPYAAGAHVRTLCELERHDDARSRAEIYLRIAEESGLGYVQNYVRMPLALVESELGDYTGASAMSDAVIESFKDLGTTGLNLAVAYEIRARIALNANDRSGFEHYAELSREQLPSGAHRLLGAKYERLAQRARALDVASIPLDEITIVSEFTAMLKSCESWGARARAGLEMLTRKSGAIGGILYGNAERGLVRSVESGAFEPDASIEALAHDYFQSETIDREVTQSLTVPAATSNLASGWRGSGTLRYVPVLLSHQSARGLALTGLAVLVVEASSRFVYPSRFAEEFSRLALEAGDVAATYV